MKTAFAKNFGITITLFMTVFTTTVRAADFIVTSVVREFPMKTGDTQFKDFYINAGQNNGLKEGIFIDAIRRMAAFDNINSKLLGDTPVRIAKLKIIHIDKNVAIARLVKMYEKDKTPLVGFDSVMIGDFIEVSQKQ